jgi:flagella basal body P-ring formation protein FlgA
MRLLTPFRAAVAAVAGVISFCWVAVACAGVPVELRAQIVDDDGQITLGELFDGFTGPTGVVVATRSGPTAVLDAGQLQVAAHRAGLDWANTQGLRRVIVRAGAAGPTASAGSARTASRNVQVLTYARSLNAGEVVQPADVVWASAAMAPGNAPRDAGAVIGMTARRPLREGAAVAISDVAAPQVIRAGDTVTVTYMSGGVTLAMQGRAVGAAALGDSVVVRNTQSNRTFEAVASGPGQAVVGPAAQQFRSQSAQFALR